MKNDINVKTAMCIALGVLTISGLYLLGHQKAVDDVVAHTAVTIPAPVEAKVTEPVAILPAEPTKEVDSEPLPTEEEKPDVNK